jgi:hypothetical protein
MSTHHVFVNLEICPAILGVRTLHPPQAGGFAIADFESSETDHAKLLRLGEGATSLMLQKQRGDKWELLQTFAANQDGLDEALYLGRKVAERAPWDVMQLVSANGTEIRHWSKS